MVCCVDRLNSSQLFIGGITNDATSLLFDDGQFGQIVHSPETEDLVWSIEVVDQRYERWWKAKRCSLQIDVSP